MSLSSLNGTPPKKRKPSALGYLLLQFKLWRNQRAKRAGKPEPYTINLKEKFSQRRPIWTIAPARIWRKFNQLPAIVIAAIYAFFGILAVVLSFGAQFDWGGVTTELWGLLAEVLVLGIVIFYVGEKSQTSQFIARQHEVISDFRYWQSDEAKFRILGAVRRLQEAGITKIDLTGVKLSDAKMKENKIADLSGAKLSGGNWWDTIGVRAVSAFERVDFADCRCRATQFSVQEGLTLGGHRFSWTSQGTYTDCNFENCDLSDAVFDEAELVWSSPPPFENFELMTEDDHGNPIYNQTHFGPFYHADLTNVSFRFASFSNADFRNAFEIESCDFTGAKGLETCIFETDDLKAEIIAKAKVGQE